MSDKQKSAIEVVFGRATELFQKAVAPLSSEQEKSLHEAMRPDLLRTLRASIREVPGGFSRPLKLR